MDLTSPEFWLAVGQIIMIDILLGGDNAVVIALACRKLPPRSAGWAFFGVPPVRWFCVSCSSCSRSRCSRCPF
jgi:hypothetical protein